MLMTFRSGGGGGGFAWIFALAALKRPACNAVSSRDKPSSVRRGGHGVLKHGLQPIQLFNARTNLPMLHPSRGAHCSSAAAPPRHYRGEHRPCRSVGAQMIHGSERRFSATDKLDRAPFRSFRLMTIAGNTQQGRKEGRRRSNTECGARTGRRSLPVQWPRSPCEKNAARPH